MFDRQLSIEHQQIAIVNIGTFNIITHFTFITIEKPKHIKIKKKQATAHYQLIWHVK